MDLPSPIDSSLHQYVLHLADNALVLGHRNSEWTGHGPILEQDIALSNIALDLVGQARYLYQHAARIMNEGAVPEALVRGGMPGVGASEAIAASGGGRVTEDSLAYGRDAWDFRNCLLVEQTNGDWGKTILRQFLFSAWQYFFYEQLQQSRDSELAAIAEKSYKEVIYHLRWSSEWVIRLGDGTEESHDRMEKALDQLWKFTGELFVPAGYEKSLVAAGIAVDAEALRASWEEKVDEVFAEAQLARPGVIGGEPSGAKVPNVPEESKGTNESEQGTQFGRSSERGTKLGRSSGAAAKSEWTQTGGKDGRHTEELGYLLAEMQFLQRAYPGCEW
jgi:ring-1,2-phenylacetyl-CoA epoxidase subunit PaaC